MKKILIMTFFLSLTLFCRAQDDSVVMTDEDKIELQNRAKEKITAFVGYLGTIASKDVSDIYKDEAVASALDLFIGKGYKYETLDDNNNPIEHNPVTMQTSNKSGRKYPPKPMTLYLKNLRDLKQYTKVVIETADAVRVDQVTETGDGKYRAVAYYFQKFIGMRDGKVLYQDYTQKKLTIYIERKQIPTPDGNMNVWVIQLGDVSAEETK